MLEILHKIGRFLMPTLYDVNPHLRDLNAPAKKEPAVSAKKAAPKKASAKKGRPKKN